MFIISLLAHEFHPSIHIGEGFCVFSDIAVAANLALTEFSNRIEKILILDLDVHQGNGNAVLFKNDDRVFTFSAHCKDNYFSKKQESNIDIEMNSNCSDEEYITMLQRWLPYLAKHVKPDLVFYQAGIYLLLI